MKYEDDDLNNLLLENEDKQKALTDQQGSYDSTGALTGALASLGAAFQGKDSMAAVNQIQGQRQQMRKDDQSALDKWKAGKLADIQAKREGQKFGREQEFNSENDTLDSATSKSKQALASKMVPGTDFSKMSGSQIDKILPSVEKMYAVDQKRIEDIFKRQDLRETRAFQRDEKLRKDKELSSAQAKQMGLYSTGKLAEDQYDEAVSHPEDYDPTGVGQIIDNSSWAPNFLKNNNAIKSQAAQANWVEAYLRDASGAAIPPAERMSYAKDFFAQPGDPADVVANKNALRQQKMQNALVGAGDMGRQTLAGMQGSGGQKTPQQLAQEEIARRKAAKVARKQ